MIPRLLIALPLLTPALACAASGPSSHFLVGHYLLVGQGMDSDRTYSGKVEIFINNGRLGVKRLIDGRLVAGSADIEPALGGEAEVLRIRFAQDGKHYEQTCLWQSDLDNYARISCYLYRPGVNTSRPGLEVLFHDQQAE